MRAILDHHLVVGEEHVENDLAALAETLKVADDFAGSRVAVVGDGVKLGRPLLELLLPGCHHFIGVFPGFFEVERENLFPKSVESSLGANQPPI